MKRLIIFTICILLTLSLATAATLKGAIYNADLELEQNVLLEINTIPTQKLLVKAGTYSLELSLGVYNLTAIKGDFKIVEEIKIVDEKGSYTNDLFLLPDFLEEEQLWQESEEDYSIDENILTETRTWAYVVLAGTVAFAFYRIIKARRKYGSLTAFRRKVAVEQKKTVEEFKQEIQQEPQKENATEPGYLQETIEIIKKNEGRISQRQLRKEMLHLSEAKISLILTELKHQGKIEKIKQGRGNVILLK